jgi:hypothetical protein
VTPRGPLFETPHSTRDQLLSNDECDRKADFLADYLHTTAIAWIVDQECAEIARKEESERIAAMEDAA